ncbi:MAG: MFS transporter [Chitinispirillaceae bacterium]|nr:MFS transporter [Chitinispirillaceae bacterium]
MFKKITIPFDRNVGIVALALFMLMSGMSLVGPLLPLFIKEIGGYTPGEAAVWTGAIQGITFFMGALFSPIWGNLGDRFGRKTMVLRAFFGMSVTMALISFAATPSGIFVIRMIHGCLAGAISASVALVASFTSEKRMGSTLAFLHTAILAGNIGGPFIGGILADAFGFRACFLITSAILLLCGILILLFVKETFTRPAKEATYSIRDNFRYFFSNRQLLIISLVVLLVQMGQMGIGAVLPLFIAQLYHSTVMVSTVVGSVFAVTGFSAAIGASFWGRRADKKGFRPSLLVAVGSAAISLFVLPMAGRMWQVYPVRLATGLFASGILPMLQSLVALNTVAERRGGMVGTVMISHWLGNALGPVCMGSMAAVIGFRVSLAFSGLLFCAAWLAVAVGIDEKRVEEVNVTGIETIAAEA